jgi:hypothetical protein
VEIDGGVDDMLHLEVPHTRRGPDVALSQGDGGRAAGCLRGGWHFVRQQARGSTRAGLNGAPRGHKMCI